jgi:hypothetical protein
VVESTVAETGRERAETYVVWVPILRGDDMTAASEAAHTYDRPGVEHYWDGSRALAIELGAALAIPPSRFERGPEHGVAWDVYLLYDRSARWTALGKPTAWMHQLTQLEGTQAVRLDADGLRTRLLGIVNAPR